MAAAFLGEKGDRKHPLANPLHADLRGFPPIYIQVGGYEALLDDSHALAEAVRKADGEVKLDVFPEMQHVFQFLAGAAPEADEAIGKLAATDNTVVVPMMIAGFTDSHYFREKGLDGIGVADLMKEAGLTVGGFYKHFGSRDELVAEALGLAFDNWQTQLDRRSAEGKPSGFDPWV